MTDFRLLCIRGTLSKVTLEWGKENTFVSSTCLVPLLGSLVQYWTCQMGPWCRDRRQSPEPCGRARVDSLFLSQHLWGTWFWGKKMVKVLSSTLWRCFFHFFHAPSNYCSFLSRYKSGHWGLPCLAACLVKMSCLWQCQSLPKPAVTGPE